MITLGNFFFHYRNALFPLVFLFVLLLGKPEYAGHDRHLDAVMDLVGIAVAFLGQTLRIITIGYDYIVRGGKNKQMYANRLVQGGVFAHSRNPLYLGNFFIVIGLALIANVKLFYLFGLPFIALAYISIILAEENYLRHKFGVEYEEYCRRVNRIWPNWKGFQHSIEGMAFNWKRLLSKEYNTLFGLLAGIIGLRIWSIYYLSGQTALKEIHVLIFCLIPIAIAYGIVRFLKKTGQLLTN